MLYYVEHICYDVEFFSKYVDLLLLSAHDATIDEDDLTALAFYDTFLTLATEIKYIWKQKFDVLSVLFLWQRLSVLVSSVFGLLSSHANMTLGCPLVSICWHDCSCFCVFAC